MMRIFIFIILMWLSACGGATSDTVQADKTQDPPQKSDDGPDSGEALSESDFSDTPFTYTLERGRTNVELLEQIPITHLNALRAVKVEIPDAVERNAVCNDGSAGVFYVRKGQLADRWLFILEGGGGCNSLQECKDRVLEKPNLMTNKNTPDVLDKSDGIFDPSDNNILGRVNLVYVPYCTSDYFTGSVDAKDSPVPGVAFHGHDILDAIFNDLQSQRFQNLPDLDAASTIILSGFSAGGTGAYAYVPFLSDRLPESVNLFGLIDSYGPEIETYSNVQEYASMRSDTQYDDLEYLPYTLKMNDIIRGTFAQEPEGDAVVDEEGHLIGYGSSAAWQLAVNKKLYLPCANKALEDKLPLMVCFKTLYLRQTFSTPLLFFGSLRDHYILNLKGLTDDMQGQYPNAVYQFAHDKIKTYVAERLPQDAIFLYDDNFHVGLHTNPFYYGAINNVRFPKLLLDWMLGQNTQSVFIENPSKYGFSKTN